MDIDYNLKLKGKSNKINHINKIIIGEESKEMIRESILDYERAIEIYKSNLEELETKRLTILYEEKEKKNEKIR